jgi:SAM-dependent methyltransferase
VRESRRHADAAGTSPRDVLTWLLFVSGTAVSRVGERLGVSWLTYNPLLFGWFHLVGVRIAPGLYAALLTTFPDARRVADVGAGSGAMAAQGRRLGLDVVACEHSPFGRLLARAQGVRSVPFDVTRDPPARLGPPADLVCCIEVAEHLPAELGDRLVPFLGTLGPVVLFTAATPGQGGQGHVNEQPREYWIERFARSGMTYLPEQTGRVRGALEEHLHHGPWIARNAMVFAARPAAGTPAASPPRSAPT